MHGTANKKAYRIVIGVPRLGIPDLLVTNGPAGFGPAGPGHESPATALPAPIALAATWDVDAARTYGAIAAGEAGDLGNTFFEAPDVNIARVPQNGRTFEAYGEDPFLVSRLTVANVQGIQSQGLIANVKHYALNNQEAQRFVVNVVVDQRTMREIYLPAFEAAVKEGKAASVMGAYNKVNGVYCCENDVLLDQILRKDWGFRGFVSSDFRAVHSTVPTVMTGLDVEMPTGKYLGKPLKAAVQSGEVPESVVDEHLICRFRTMMEIGVWDHPPERKPIPAEKNAETARHIAEKGVVLLRNEGGLLPLDVKQLKTVVLIGPGAVKAAIGGGGSSRVIPIIKVVSPVEGLRRRLGEGVKVRLIPGDDIPTAADVAGESDLAIVMLHAWQTEGRDHKIALSGSQDALVEAVAVANPKTVVVLKTGGPVLMPWAEKVPAIIEAWYPGQMDAEVVPAVLLGDCNPSGKLPITFPKRAADLPAHTPEQYPGVNGEARYSEGVMVGYRWFDRQKIEPLYPFGHGLSYSDFVCDYLKLSADKLSTAAPQLTVEFDVVNNSGPGGVEVAQVYLGLPSLPDVPQPPRQLKGFARLSIAPGKTVHARVTLDPRAFSYWDVKTHGWKVAPGEYTVEVGSSSRDIRLKGRVTLE
ncbi:MAG: glycoside hydrolase family 3 C-terminal domain-containing protein [Pirellulales bacterium]|nr:glycoside hydrolase family 3 C-terminal domain-containing protein [Pirellulales bacterium]